MAIQLLGADGLTIATIDPTHGAQRTSIRPQECLSWASLGATTGLVTALAAGASLFSLRNAGANKILVRRLQIAWLTMTFSAAARIDFALNLARTFNAMDSGGTDLPVTAKHRVTHNAPTINARIASTAALTVGTRTLDGVVGVAGYYSAANGSALPSTPLLSHDAGDHPIVLAQNEGLVLTALAVPAAAAVTVGYVNVELVEVAQYP